MPPLAFATGGSLTALGLAAALHVGALDAFANVRPAPATTDFRNPRVERLVSLLEAQSECDAACLSALRGQADKTMALEQALGGLQASVSESRTRLQGVEAERAQSEARFQQEKAGLDGKVKDLERRLADAEARLQAAQPSPVARPASAAPPKPVPAKAAAGRTVSPGWLVLGMTATTVVVSTPDHQVIALGAGESFQGVTVKKIDVAQGLAETSAGTLAYAGRR
jgi:hypothetical protein